MLSKLLRTLGLTVLLFAVPAPVSHQAEAQGRSFCAPRQNIVELLDRRFQEKRQAIGLVNQASLIELYVSRKGTWSMVRTDVAGNSCVVASGHAWQHAPRPAVKPQA